MRCFRVGLGADRRVGIVGRGLEGLSTPTGVVFTVLTIFVFVTPLR